LLIKYLINYLDCGILIERKGVAACDFRVRSIADINQKIIPFFEKYPVIPQSPFGGRVAGFLITLVVLAQEI
jgi:hypothetical protein